MTKTCTLDNCESQFLAKGLCPKHYQRLRKTGTTDPSPVVSRVCDVPDCDRKHKGHGMCSLHLNRLRVSSPSQTCTLAGCSATLIAKGMCQKHYKRLRNTGTLELRPRLRVPGTCKADDCDRPDRASSGRFAGLCSRHMMRLRHTGTTGLLDATFGYSTMKSGTFYLVMNDALDAVKYGVSNDPDRRFREHARSGFDRVIASYTDDDGRVAFEAERIFHDLRSTLPPAVEADAMACGGFTETFIAADFRAEHGLTAAAWFDLAWDLTLEAVAQKEALNA